MKTKKYRNKDHDPIKSPVAKMMNDFNQAQTHRDKKNDYNRKPKHKKMLNDDTTERLTFSQYLLESSN